MPAYPQQRIFNLAARLGITVREEGALCGRKGARVRRMRARQCACLTPEQEEERVRRLRWDLKDAF